MFFKYYFRGEKDKRKEAKGISVDCSKDIIDNVNNKIISFMVYEEEGKFKIYWGCINRKTRKMNAKIFSFDEIVHLIDNWKEKT
jgi:hypothetical protein